MTSGSRHARVNARLVIAAQVDAGRRLVWLTRGAYLLSDGFGKTSAGCKVCPWRFPEGGLRNDVGLGISWKRGGICNARWDRHRVAKLRFVGNELIAFRDGVMRSEALKDCVASNVVSNHSFLIPASLSDHLPDRGARWTIMRCAARRICAGCQKASTLKKSRPVLRTQGVWWRAGPC